MSELTQEEAERCQRACAMPVDIWNKLIWRVNLNDPFFWRPRLEDRLREVADAVNKVDGVEIVQRSYKGLYHISVNTLSVVSPPGARDECSALCEAIESLALAATEPVKSGIDQKKARGK